MGDFFKIPEQQEGVLAKFEKSLPPLQFDDTCLMGFLFRYQAAVDSTLGHVFVFPSHVCFLALNKSFYCKISNEEISAIQKHKRFAFTCGSGHSIG